MVAVLHAAPHASAPHAIAAWLATLRGIYPDEDLGAFEAAFAYARERCGTTSGREGEPLIDRAVGTATILAGLKLDAGTIRAALLSGVPGAGAFAPDEIVSRFGADVATLVAGTARMDEIRALPTGRRRRACGAGGTIAQNAVGDGRGHSRRLDKAC